MTLAVALPWEVQSVVDLRVEWRDYEAPSAYQPAVGPRRDRIAILRAGLARTLWDRLSAELDYRFTDRDSNVNFFVYDRHEISLMATYRYSGSGPRSGLCPCPGRKPPGQGPGERPCSL